MVQENRKTVILERSLILQAFMQDGAAEKLPEFASMIAKLKTVKSGLGVGCSKCQLNSILEIVAGGVTEAIVTSKDDADFVRRLKSVFTQDPENVNLVVYYRKKTDEPSSRQREKIEQLIL